MYFCEFRSSRIKRKYSLLGCRLKKVLTIKKLFAKQNFMLSPLVDFGVEVFDDYRYFTLLFRWHHFIHFWKSLLQCGLYSFSVAQLQNRCCSYVFLCSIPHRLKVIFCAIAQFGLNRFLSPVQQLRQPAVAVRLLVMVRSGYSISPYSSYLGSFPLYAALGRPSWGTSKLHTWLITITHFPECYFQDFLVVVTSLILKK